MPRLHPQADLFVDPLPCGAAPDAILTNTKSQHGLCSCCCESIAQLTSAVEELALRHDKLMVCIDTHFQKFAPKLCEPEELQQSGLQPDALPRLPTCGDIPESKNSAASFTTSAAKVSTRKTDSMVDSALFENWRNTGLHRWMTRDWTESVDGFMHTRKFEVFSGSVISINMVLLFVQLQLQSCETAAALGHSEHRCDWPRVSVWFKVAELAFNIWYLFELLLRAFTSRWRFFTDPLNIVDIVAVCTAGFQYAFAEVQFLGVAPLRFFRVLRALRVIRIIRLLSIFKELHILLKTLAASFYSFQWSICLLGAIVWSSGLLVMQFLDAYIQDVSQDWEIREEMYLQYGTPLRAAYSMFVAAFRSQWVPPARQMIEHVNHFFAVFWVLYIVMVNFMVIRVIAALFLKQTMDIASQDTERRAMERQKQKERFARILRELFIRFDTSGDGKISKDEFDEMIVSRSVLRKFRTLGLDYEEVCALFDVMCSDDGVADYEEFLTGAMLMNNSARTFDTIRIMHQMGSLMKSIHAIERRMGIADR